MPSYTYRKKRREAVLRKMATWRASKERKRLERGPVEQEPKMERWNRYTITVNDRLTGESGTFEVRSLRNTMARLAVMLRYYH
jgi:hypothetical protein